MGLLASPALRRIPCDSESRKSRGFPDRHLVCIETMDPLLVHRREVLPVAGSIRDGRANRHCIEGVAELQPQLDRARRSIKAVRRSVIEVSNELTTNDSTPSAILLCFAHESRWSVAAEQ